MPFCDYEGVLCAYIGNRGFVCADANSPRFDGEPPMRFAPTACDEAAPHANPYGGVPPVHRRLPPDMRYNAALQESAPEDWPNPCTETSHGCAAASSDAGDAPFPGDPAYDTEEDESVRALEARCPVL